MAQNQCLMLRSLSIATIINDHTPEKGTMYISLNIQASHSILMDTIQTFSCTTDVRIR